MGYELKPDDVYGLARKLNAETKVKGEELFFKRCPYCNGGADDLHTFSINLQTGQYKCFRASCGKQGHFVRMARDFEYPLEFENERPKNYRKIPQIEIEVRQPAIAYMEKRGISVGICRRYKITTQKENPNILVFPFHDEHGVLQFVKYRKADFAAGRDKNKEWCEKDTMPILFGMDQCSGFERLVLTEGQIDSLTLAECGIENAVSVPTGAMGFTWLSNCWDWINKFSEIVVFGDYEKGKVTLVDELSKRLRMRILVVQAADYLGEKDANQILLKYGKDAVITAVTNAAIQPVKFIKELADVKAVDIYNLARIETGIWEIDKVVGGIYFGQVVLLTGKRGEGKSTFMSQLVAEALDQNYKTLVYSGELTDYHFKRWLDFQVAGSRNVVVNKNAFGDETYLLHDSTVEQINTWYRGKAFIYDDSIVEDDEMEDLLTTIENAICRYGIQFICLDNLMTALDIDMKDDLYRGQSKFVKQLKVLAVRYNVAILLVAHPRKTNGAVTDNDDVSGSGDISNRVDVVMIYGRPTEGTGFDGTLAVTKNRLTGKLTRAKQPIELLYSQSTKRITSLNTSHEKEYGWSKNQCIEIEETSDLPF